MKQTHKRYTPEQRNQARALYWQGWRVSHIAQELGINRATLEKWKRENRWDESTVIERIISSVEARYVQLIHKEKKSNGDYKEIECLSRELKNQARIKNYIDTGRETELSPKIKARNEAPRKERQNPNYLTDKEIEDLRQCFFERIFAYQQRWYDNRAQRNRWILKSRQIGATWYRAQEALLVSLETGHDHIFISASKKQALEFKAHVTDWVLDVTNKKLVGEDIKLHNNARQRYLGTNFRSVQGYSGHVTIDEAFWLPDFGRIYEIAKAMATHAHFTTTVTSTASSKTHAAYGYWSGSEMNKELPDDEKLVIDLDDNLLRGGHLGPDLIWRNRLTVYDAVAEGCNLIDIDILKKERSASSFANKFMCEFMDDQDAVFRFDELQRCLVDADVVWKDFNRYTARPFLNAPVWVSCDASYTRHHTTITVIAPATTPKGKFRVLELYTLQKADFETQAATIRKIHQKYNMQHLDIDITGGYGLAVYDLVKGFFPRVNGLKYDMALKMKMILKMQSVLKHRRFEYDAGDSSITRAFLSIRQVLSESQKHMTFETGNSEEAGHGDAAWAIMQSLLNEPLDAERAGRRKSSISIARG